MTVTFADSAGAPTMADLSSYQLSICGGGNTAGSWIEKLLVSAGTFTTPTTTVTVPVTFGGTDTNA